MSCGGVPPSGHHYGRCGRPVATTLLSAGRLVGLVVPVRVSRGRKSGAQCGHSTSPPRHRSPPGPSPPTTHCTATPTTALWGISVKRDTIEMHWGTRIIHERSGTDFLHLLVRVCDAPYAWLCGMLGHVAVSPGMRPVIGWVVAYPGPPSPCPHLHTF